jgi:RHS repeat-associated protein
VTDRTGQIVYKANYRPFGTPIYKDGDFDELHGFTGKEYDADIGLYYFNARWYDPELGRFINEDPAGDPNNPNLYTYCRNNPLSYIDSDGHFAFLVALLDGLIGGAMGGAISSLMGGDFWTGFTAGFAAGFFVGGFNLINYYK